jgi:nicotinamidase-related amidase
MIRDTALLVIDVQQGLIDEGAYKADHLLANVGSLTAKARGANVPVIYVQHDADDPQDSLYPSSPGNAIVQSIAPHPGELVVHKTTASVFDSSNLQQKLEAMGIHKLVIAGMQTDFCVNASSRGALKLGYDVTLVSDAHTTGNTPTTQQIIDDHNRDLEKEGAHVVTTDRITFQV